MLLCLKIIKLVPANNNQIKKENVPPTCNPSVNMFLFFRGGLKDMKRKVKRTISTRSNRRPFTPIRYGHRNQCTCR